MFSPKEREILLGAKWVGPTILQRLEDIGLGSLKELSHANAETITRLLAAELQTTCWKNSPQARMAIENAIEAARQNDGSG